MKGWLDKYQDGGNMQEHQPNYNDSKVLYPPNFVGDGYINTPNRYNSAWGGSFQNGGGIPGSVGFTYARTGSTPSNGKHAKKTKPSAQDGMTFYQNGLDFKPKTISQDGSIITPQDVTHISSIVPTDIPEKNQLTYSDLDKHFPDYNPSNFRDRVNSSFINYLSNINVVEDDSPVSTYGEDKPELKYLRNAKISSNAKQDIVKYSKQYNLDPNTLLSAISIEGPEVTANGWNNTNDLALKMLEKIGIPAYSSTTGITGEITVDDLAKNAGAYMKDGSINNKKLEKKIKEWIPAFNKVDSTLNSIESPIQAHAMFLSEFGLGSVNPKQQKLKGVKKSYPEMVNQGAEYIRSKKLFENKKDGGIIQDDNGYWNPNNWGKPVEINSNNITMYRVNQNLIGISDEGDTKMMTPNKNYKFHGTKVIEYPLAKDGKQLKLLDQLINFNNFGQSKKNWLSKYE